MPATLTLPQLEVRPRTRPDTPAESLVDAYIARQRDLTAVERFASYHAAAEADALATPAQTKYYRDLIPLTAPGPGQQYAFQVDLDACSGCKACVVACHSLNGLDDDETWRGVGLLVGGTPQGPVLQHVTSACHHCLEPACMDGCPVLAYEKDPVTGIVRHLDDQCIGCQYCILKCPYDVPKYNKKKGIVRKCDLCSGRLAAGEAPACVQSCPNQAIRVRLVDTTRVAEDGKANGFLPGAANPDYTLPTTQYKHAKPLPQNTLPADHYQVAPEHAHLPLVAMLVLTQLSTGGFAVGQVLSCVVAPDVMLALRPLNALLALAIGLLALGASTLHLGRPLYAFRAVLGLRRSWLSREIVAFGLFSMLATAYAACSWLPAHVAPARVTNALGTAVALVGLVGVFCSVMIYHDTRRVFWAFRYTATKFLLSTLLLGVATVLLSAVASAAWSGRLDFHGMLRGWGRPACLLMAGVSAVKLAFGLITFRHLRDRDHTPMRRTARLLIGPLLRPVLARIALALVGGTLLPLLACLASSGPRSTPAEFAILTVASFAMTLAAEFLERYLFFTAVIAPRMPGGVGA